MVENKIKVSRFESILSNYLKQKMTELKSSFFLTIEASGIFRKDIDYKVIEIDYFIDFRERMTLLWKKKRSIIFDGLPINATEERVRHECYRLFYDVIYPEYKEFLEEFFKKFKNKKNIPYRVF
ncbi:hypothetical protein [Enterococcus mundtii]|uniref:hypothetical protein n=1 Tax=Enterococcus mundtii TaxID=53346 RepID=UPI00082467B4|nr:hypothetical protein [Enterococcus mundtii]